MVNVGSNDISIVRQGILFTNGFEFHLTKINKSIPVTLKNKDSVELTPDFDIIQSGLNEYKFNIGEYNKPMYFFVEDSTGRRYYTKTKHNIDYYLHYPFLA